jgi:transposase
VLKIVLYAYIDEGQVSYSKLERLCKETIPYILIANGETPSANTFCSFVNNYLVDNIDNIFFDIVLRLIEIMCICTATMFIDGTKFESRV